MGRAKSWRRRPAVQHGQHRELYPIFHDAGDYQYLELMGVWDYRPKRLGMFTMPRQLLTPGSILAEALLSSAVSNGRCAYYDHQLRSHRCGRYFCLFSNSRRDHLVAHRIAQ